MLGEEPVRGAACEEALEQRTRLGAPADDRERVHVPERADEERVLRLAEIVALDIAEDEVAALELGADRVDSRDEPRVVGGEESELVEQQQARVESAAVGGTDEALSFGVPAALVDEARDARRVSAPFRRALGIAELGCDAREPVSSGPAHDDRERVHA